MKLPIPLLTILLILGTGFNQGYTKTSEDSRSSESSKPQSSETTPKETGEVPPAAAAHQVAIIQMLVDGNDQARKARLESLLRISSAMAKKAPASSVKKDSPEKPSES